MSEGVVPKNGEYMEGKLWFERQGITVTVGLTNSAIDEVGQVEQIDFPSEGQDFEKGDVVVTIEGTSGSLEVIAPATGSIGAVNESAQAEPEIIVEDPLEEGWLFKIQIEDAEELNELKEL